MNLLAISSPISGIGIPLGETLDMETPEFLIHECGFSPCIEAWITQPIVSPFWCLWYILDEGNWVESDGKRWDIGPECIMFAPAQVIYATRNSHPFSLIWLHFSLIPEYAFMAPEPFSVNATEPLRQQIGMFIDAYRTPPLDTRVLYHHAAAILNMCFAQNPISLRVLPDDLRSLLKVIDTEIGSDLSNPRMARLMNLSTSGFVKWFEAQMNQTPATYIRQVRYNKASQMLAFTDLSIEQIANDLGYPNRHYFSRAFAMSSGCGPATFRKRYARHAGV